MVLVSYHSKRTRVGIPSGFENIPYVPVAQQARANVIKILDRLS